MVGKTITDITQASGSAHSSPSDISICSAAGSTVAQDRIADLFTHKVHRFAGVLYGCDGVLSHVAFCAFLILRLNLDFSC